MFCKNCGTELAEGTRFCTKCGYDQNSDRPFYGIPEKRPKTYMVLAIIVTVCCCIPFGIVSLIYASRVDSAWNTGHYEDAGRFSAKARNWALWGIILSVLFYVVYIILIVAGVSWAMWWDDIDTFYTCLIR